MPQPDDSLRALKGRAQLLKPVVRLGKAGLSDELLSEINEALDRFALVKIRFEAFKENRKALAKEIVEKTGAKLVLFVGHTLTIFRRKAEKDSE
jgi:RNA-binding protein